MNRVLSLPQSVVRFAIVGIVATTIHIIVVSILIPYFDVDVGISNGIAFVVATFFSKIVNTRWTFQTSMTQRILLRFWSVSIIGALLSVFISKFAESAGMHYLNGVLLVVLFVPAIAYCCHHFWTYR
jgi:putative flippase GtrA